MQPLQPPPVLFLVQLEVVAHIFASIWDFLHGVLCLAVLLLLVPLLLVLLLLALVAVMLVELAPDYAQMERTSVVPDANYVRMDPMWAAPGAS